MPLLAEKIFECRVSAEILPPVDVVVAGGGTAGVVAALAAARNGARVTLIENRGFLGGMLTGGNAGITMFTKFSGKCTDHARDLERLVEAPEELHIAGGIPLEIARRMLTAGYAVGTSGTAGSYLFTSAEDFKRELIQMLTEAGVELRFHTFAADVILEGKRLAGIVIESKSGRQVIPARQFIDCTGDGDLAVRAGAEFTAGVAEEDICFSEANRGEMMSMGVMFRVGNVDLKRMLAWLKEHPEHFLMQSFARLSLEEATERFTKGEMITVNIVPTIPIDYVENVPARWLQIYNLPTPGVVTIGCPSVEKLDGCKAEDLSRAEILLANRLGRWMESIRNIPGFEESFLAQVPEIAARETRHIAGEHRLTIEEIYHSKKFDDCIGFGSHPIDIDPRPEWMEDPETAYPPRWFFQIPFGSQVVKGVDNLLTAGRCISATHEASGCIRPTVQCMITGEAAGTAAALAVKQKIDPRELTAETLRRQLKQQGVLC